MDFTLPLLLIALASAVQGDIVKYKPCSGSSANVHCNITELRIEPCPEAAKNQACILKKGKVANIEFDFESDVANLDKLSTRAYWTTGDIDLPLIGMDTDGCHFTQCPTTGTKQLYKYGLEMSKKFPARSYDVKWRLWQEEQLSCCFIFKIKLEK